MSKQITTTNHYIKLNSYLKSTDLNTLSLK